MFERFLKTDEDKRREAEELMALLRDSPEVQAQRQREDVARQSKRQAAARQITNANAELAAKLPSLDDAILKADRRKQEAEKEFAAAKDVLARAHHARMVASLQCSERVDQAEGVLRTTADRRVDEFIEQVNEVLEKTRRGIFTVEKERQNWLGGWFHTFHSNAKTINGQTETLRNIIARAEASKFQVGIDVDVELQKLRAEIPKEIPFAEYFEMPFVSIPKTSGPIWSEAK